MTMETKTIMFELQQKAINKIEKAGKFWTGEEPLKVRSNARSDPSGFGVVLSDEKSLSDLPEGAIFKKHAIKLGKDSDRLAYVFEEMSKASMKKGIKAELNERASVKEEIIKQI